MATSSFSRTTIFCREIEKSLALYRDILRFAVIEDKSISGPAAGGLIGLKECTLRMVMLGETESAAPTIGLFNISDAPVSALPHSPPGIAHGRVAIVISTDNFDAVHEALEAADTVFLTPPVSYTKPTAGPHSPAGVYKEMIFYDPDDVLVSVLQIVPLSDTEDAQ